PPPVGIPRTSLLSVSLSLWLVHRLELRLGFAAGAVGGGVACGVEEPVEVGAAAGKDVGGAGVVEDRRLVLVGARVVLERLGAVVQAARGAGQMGDGVGVVEVGAGPLLAEVGEPVDIAVEGGLAADEEVLADGAVKVVCALAADENVVAVVADDGV